MSPTVMCGGEEPLNNLSCLRNIVTLIAQLISYNINHPFNVYLTKHIDLDLSLSPPHVYNLLNYSYKAKTVFVKLN